MERWRHGLLEIAELHIPGASSLNSFFTQGLEFERRLRLTSMPTIFVGTRSLLALMWNVLRGRRPGHGYYERPWDNLEWVEFSLENNNWREDRTQRPM